MDLSTSAPLVIGLVAVVAAAAAVARRRARSASDEIPGLDALLAAGRYDDAATLALERDQPRQAIELLIRGQRLARAAGIAARIGDHRVAGELYARAEEWEHAASAYARAGLDGPAREARAKLIKPAAKSDASSLDPTRRAEELLASGDLAGAARVYREGGLLDEAVHLYANVLGLPGEAAPLVAELGNPERAAELFEIAGMRERAARQWASVAREQRSPEALLRRIIDLDGDVAFELLDELTRARPLAKGNVEVHYHFAVLLGDRGDGERARSVLASIRDVAGDYRDVDERLRRVVEPVARNHPAEQPTVLVRPSEEAPSIDYERIAREAAEAALARARRASVRPLPETRVDPEVAPGRARTVVAGGIEERPLRLTLLADSAVRAAREGPSVLSLERFAGARGCDLGNIEVYYRLGLAHLAAGDWERALRCFEQVDDASPGYRDAAARASEVRAWRGAMGAKLSVAGGAGGVAARYALRGELGRGGMAVVYRAVDTVLDREVALKFLNADASASQELREMFQREAKSVAQLNHPNIVTLYDFGTLDGRAFIAMELVDGVSVDESLRVDGRLPVVDALRVAVQVLAALEFAHARGIIHRDVKPSNMMRGAAGVVKLMDFGLAKTVTADAKSSVIAGTPAYMPPEQFVGRGVDRRADVYALAASLYEMLSGALPWETMDRSAPPPSLRASRPEVPEIVERAVMLGLSSDPADRFPTAAEFAAPLRRVLDAVDRYSQRPPAPREAPEAEVIPTLPPPSPELAALVPRDPRATVRFGVGDD